MHYHCSVSLGRVGEGRHLPAGHRRNVSLACANGVLSLSHSFIIVSGRVWCVQRAGPGGQAAPAAGRARDMARAGKAGARRGLPRAAAASPPCRQRRCRSGRPTRRAPYCSAPRRLYALTTLHFAHKLMSNSIA